MKTLRKFLNKGISRKQYFICSLVGWLLAFPLFALTIYISYLIIGPEQIQQDQRFVFAIGGIFFVALGAYFYVLKIKRMHDIGWTSDAFGAKLVPGGDLILHALLFVKKTKSVSSHAKKIKPYFGTLQQKIIIFLIFVGINFAYFYFIGAIKPVQFSTYSELLSQTASIILLYFFLPYLYSYYFRLLYNNWRTVKR